MAETYQKIGEKVFAVREQVDVAMKIKALQDDVTRLTNEIAAINAEIASLNALK